MSLIYILDDHRAPREVMENHLRIAGHEVVGLETLAETKGALNENRPDLLLMDVMLPDGNGFLFVKESLFPNPPPLIFVTALGSESDRVTGFELGADDYIVKPFSIKELVLRVAAVLRRTAPRTDSMTVKRWVLNDQTLHINEEEHRVTLNGESVKLTTTEWKILVYLASQGAAMATREQILERCLEKPFESYDRAVDTHIKNLRRKLANPAWIETVRDYGYRFAGRGV